MATMMTPTTAAPAAPPRIAFTVLTPDDLPLLHGWLGRAHVRRWWGDPPSWADLVEHYGPYAAPDADPRAHLAWLDTRPIGYLQVYRVISEANARAGWWLAETDPGARGIDQFLADPADLGRGLGAAMIGAFVDGLFADPEVTRIQVDPAPANERAIRSYERVGFRAQRQVITPDGAALLMVCDRASRRAAAAGTAPRIETEV